MDSEFARDLIGGMEFMGSAEGKTTKQRRQRDRDMMKANQEERSVKMYHIMDNKEMGEICVCFSSVEDFKANQST
eukprot:15354802-Heterocapsa_arctica.AAC.1